MTMTICWECWKRTAKAGLSRALRRRNKHTSSVDRRLLRSRRTKATVCTSLSDDYQKQDRTLVNSFQFHGPASTTAVSIDKLKKKVAAANTSTDFVSRNKDLSAVMSKKQVEEQASPKKNKKYDNVSPRYMTVNTNATEKTPDLISRNKKEAQETDKSKPVIKQEAPVEALKKTENKNSVKELKRATNHIFESQKSLAPIVSPPTLQPKAANQPNNERGKTPNELNIQKSENARHAEQTRSKASTSPNPIKKSHNLAAQNEEQIVKNVSKILGQQHTVLKRIEPSTSYSQMNTVKSPISRPELEKANRENMQPKAQEKIDSKQQRPISPTTAAATQKKEGKKEPVKFKPETIDLCMKLDEYTKFKENINIMNDPHPPLHQIQNLPVFVQHKPNGRQNHQNQYTQQLQAPEKASSQPEHNPEEFLKGKIHTFKENSSKKRKPSTSIDLQKASQPKYKKKAVDLVDNYSFQPMLSKKSLQIAEKRVFAIDLGIL